MVIFDDNNKSRCEGYLYSVYWCSNTIVPLILCGIVCIILVMTAIMIIKDRINFMDLKNLMKNRYSKQIQTIFHVWWIIQLWWVIILLLSHIVLSWMQLNALSNLMSDTIWLLIRLDTALSDYKCCKEVLIVNIVM